MIATYNNSDVYTRSTVKKKLMENGQRTIAVSQVERKFITFRRIVEVI